MFERASSVPCCAGLVLRLVCATAWPARSIGRRRPAGTGVGGGDKADSTGSGNTNFEARPGLRSDDLEELPAADGPELDCAGIRARPDCRRAEALNPEGLETVGSSLRAEITGRQDEGRIDGSVVRRQAHAVGWHTVAGHPSKGHR